MSIELLQSLALTGTIRSRCRELSEWASADGDAAFAVHRERLPHAVRLVAEECRRNFPNLSIPVTGRLLHLTGGKTPGVSPRDRLANALSGFSSDERARRLLDYVFVSVFLDAGAGDTWKFRDADSHLWSRSEGLAVAVLDAFLSGKFSSLRDDPARVDGRKLRDFTETDVAAVFQVSTGNPLLGVPGRTSLIRSFGEIMTSSRVFSRDNENRPGFLLDHLRRTSSGAVAAPNLLALMIIELRSMWPGRISIGGVPLGDVWRHEQLRRPENPEGLIPFHKLSQWLTYSLVEPLAQGGVTVEGLDHMTGLPEYRNGGLFIDTGVLEPRDPTLLTMKIPVDHPAIVEWRALTVHLFEELCPLLRTELCLSPPVLSVPQIIEGGTWRAGRRLAAERRQGAPPIQILSDGTVF